VKHRLFAGFVVAAGAIMSGVAAALLVALMMFNESTDANQRE
jgi:hypothetical protein